MSSTDRCPSHPSSNIPKRLAISTKAISHGTVTIAFGREVKFCGMTIRARVSLGRMEHGECYVVAAIQRCKARTVAAVRVSVRVSFASDRSSRVAEQGLRKLVLSFITAAIVRAFERP
jgi:hypothetical protein